MNVKYSMFNSLSILLNFNFLRGKMSKFSVHIQYPITF